MLWIKFYVIDSSFNTGCIKRTSLFSASSCGWLVGHRRVGLATTKALDRKLYVLAPHSCKGGTACFSRRNLFYAGGTPQIFLVEVSREPDFQTQSVTKCKTALPTIDVTCRLFFLRKGFSTCFCWCLKLGRLFGHNVADHTLGAFGNHQCTTG